MKPFWQSKTVVSVVLLAILAAFNTRFTDQQKQDILGLAPTVSDIISLAATLVLTITGIYGRATAEGPLKRPGKKTAAGVCLALCTLGVFGCVQQDNPLRQSDPPVQISIYVASNLDNVSDGKNVTQPGQNGENVTATTQPGAESEIIAYDKDGNPMPKSKTKGTIATGNIQVDVTIETQGDKAGTIAPGAIENSPKTDGTLEIPLIK